MALKEVIIQTTGGAIRRTRADVPDYLKRAISDSVERGKHDARRAAVIVYDRRGKIVNADTTNQE
jgi:hypothetical protein